MIDVPKALEDCARCFELERRIVSLEEQVARLSAALEESRRAGKRQAAPFRKKQRTAKPKKPGRKPGDAHGKHAHRAVPAPEEVDETYNAPLPECCPRCQSKQLKETNVVFQYQTEIPRKPILRQFEIHRGRCEDCGSLMQGRHALQTSDAIGAAGAQLGPRAHAAMAWLNKRLGLSHGKIRQVFGELFGIRVARATSVRSNHRTAKRCDASFRQIQEAVRGSPQVTPDETGWRVGGRKAWLHAFATKDAACYAVDPTRSGGPSQALLGVDYSGVLVHDGWSVYEHFKKATHQQCTAHLINRCNELLETAVRGAVRFPRAIKVLLQRGLLLRDRYQAGAMTRHGLAVMAGRSKSRLLNLVLCKKRHQGNERLAAFLYDHLDSIFTYLRMPGVDATNWRGEHAIRYAVVNRKVWGGNRTWRGAEDQSVLMSVLQTCIMRGISPLEHLAGILTSTTPALITNMRR
jgi:transposase